MPRISRFFQRPHFRSLFVATFLAGCSATNVPLNSPLGDGQNAPLVNASITDFPDDSVYIGLAFSGGGTRASSFAYGMLEELKKAQQDKDSPFGLLDNVRLVSGVSGGSVTAAYFGLKGPKALAGYRERYLIEDGERYMANSKYNPITIAKGLSGGANSRNTFARWLDESLFKGATFGDLRRQSRILTWINAADVANRATFLFSPETFDALCSDLSKLPISEAVAASAAFPLVFSPIVLEAHQKDCDYREPDWLTSARYNQEATSAMRAHASALESYADPSRIQFVKLLDGGITDNFGTTGLSVARARAQNQYGPLTPTEAVRLKRMLFLVANAGVESNYDWTQKIKGPGGVELGMSIATSAMSAATRTGYDVMRLTLDAWQEDLIEYRCSLSLREVKRLRGTTKGWNCEDLKLFVGQASFEGLPKEMRAKLNDIPTRLRLKEEEVDLAIQAGRMATRQNPDFNGFLRSLEGFKPRGTRVGATQVAPRRVKPISN